MAARTETVLEKVAAPAPAPGISLWSGAWAILSAVAQTILSVRPSAVPPPPSPGAAN